MKTPVQMTSEDPPQTSPNKQQAEHPDHVSADSMKQQIKQELPHAAQGQETCCSVLGRMLVTKELQPKVECGNHDMQVRPHITPVLEHRPRLSRRSRRKKFMMARHRSSGPINHGKLSPVLQLLQILPLISALGGIILPYGTASSSPSVDDNRAETDSSSSGRNGVGQSPNSNISAVGVNPNVAMSPDLQPPVQVVHHPVVEVSMESSVVLFEPGFLSDWEDRMTLSNPSSLIIPPGVPEDIE